MMVSLYKQKLPMVLALLFTVFFIVLAINPVSREVWFAEVIPVIIIFCALSFTFNYFRFSNAAYLLMAFWMFWHTIGAHYTFANVPFDWFNNLIASDRNHFDRISHFSVGFYAYPMAEWLLRKKYCGLVLALLFSLFMVMSIAAAYEIIEWWYAVLQGGEAAIEFLGSQGDIWDAQKDMMMDTLGAICTLFVFVLIRSDKRSA